MYDLKVNNGVNIRAINASFGGSSYSQIEENAIKKLNSVDILLVASAGNEDVNVDFYPSYPASHNLPNVISVGALDRRGYVTSYSNYGQGVHISAPGGDYNPLVPGHQCMMLSTNHEPNGYSLTQGTSFSAPMVTGSLALIASQRPYLSSKNLKELLLAYSPTRSNLVNLVQQERFLNIGTLSNAPNPGNDLCPSDPNKYDPGACGCDIPENYKDTDKDGVLDCNDQCPNDPKKVAPLVCGCGVVDKDGNQNGIMDCKESEATNPLYERIKSLKPMAPNLRLARRKKGDLFIVTAPNHTGYQYRYRLDVHNVNNKFLYTKYFLRDSRRVNFTGMVNNHIYYFSYYLKVPGENLWSLESHYRGFRYNSRSTR